MIGSRSWWPLVVALLALTACGKPPGAETTPEEAALTAVGDPAPAFALDTLAGDRFDLVAQRGKVVLVNFWATWCPPCRAEMPHLQDEVWRRFGGHESFAMISVAREEDEATIAPFVAGHGYGWPFASDVDRAVFARFATAYIPRNYVIDRDGVIVYQGQGFEEAEFTAMTAVIAAQLAASP